VTALKTAKLTNHPKEETMEMREITANVKKTLLRSGFDNNNLSVKRGRGTAAFWIKIELDIDRDNNCYCGEPDNYGRRELCDNCKNKWRDVYNKINTIAEVASGREARHIEHKNILVQLGFKN
jgi:hypothetical protein